MRSPGRGRIAVLGLGALLTLSVLTYSLHVAPRAAAEPNAAVLAVTKSTPQSTIAIGQTITWTVTVSNTGDVATSGPVTMTDNVPDTYDTVAASGTGWNCGVNVNGLVTCTNQNPLAAGASYPSVQITARAANCNTSDLTVSNRAGAFGGGSSGNALSQFVPTTLTGCPAFSVTKTPAGPTAPLGAPFTWDVTVTNSGGAPTTGTVTMTDDLPQAFGNASAQGDGWTCTVSVNGRVQCTRGNALAAGSSYPAIRITATPINCSTSNVQNVARASGGGAQGTFNSSAVPTTITDCGAISGVLSMEGRTSSSPGGTGFGAGFSMATVTATRTDTTGQAPVTVSASSSGAYSFPNLPFGTYTLTTQAPGYLSAQRTNVPVASGSVAMPPVQLRGGLVTADQVVNIHDITVMLASFGQSLDDRRDASDRVVDINGDGTVNITDVVIAINNFGKSSPQPW